jgi:hypothetical protein
MGGPAVGRRFGTLRGLTGDCALERGWPLARRENEVSDRLADVVVGGEAIEDELLKVRIHSLENGTSFLQQPPYACAPAAPGATKEVAKCDKETAQFGSTNSTDERRSQ